MAELSAPHWHKRSEMLRFKHIKHAGNSVPGCVGGPVLRVGLQAGGQAEAKSYKYFPQLGSSSRPQGLQSKTLQSALPRGGKEIKALACHQQRHRQMSNKHLYCSRRSNPKPTQPTTVPASATRKLQLPGVHAGENYKSQQSLRRLFFQGWRARLLLVLLKGAW